MTSIESTVWGAKAGVAPGWRWAGSELLWGMGCVCLWGRREPHLQQSLSPPNYAKTCTLEGAWLEVESQSRPQI